MDLRSLLGSRPINNNKNSKTRPDRRQHQRTEQQFALIPMKEGEKGSETDQDPSILEVPAWNWARYVGVKGVQYVKTEHAPKVAALDEKNWDLEQAVRETEKNYSTDLQLRMTETTNDPTLLQMLVCLERQQHELIPEEYQTHKKKLSSRFGVVFIDDRIIVPKNLRTTMISLLHKGHPAINEAPLLDMESPKTPELIEDTTKKRSTFGRGSPNIIRDRSSPISVKTPMPGNSMGPPTITTRNMTDTEVDRAIEDATRADQEIFIRDENGNTVYRLNSEATPGQTKAKPEGGRTTSKPITGPNSDVTTDCQP